MADTVYRLTAKEGSSWWEGLCGWHSERKVIPNGIYTLNRMNYQVKKNQSSFLVTFIFYSFSEEITLVIASSNTKCNDTFFSHQGHEKMPQNSDIFFSELN